MSLPTDKHGRENIFEERTAIADFESLLATAGGTFFGRLRGNSVSNPVYLDCSPRFREKANEYGLFHDRTGNDFIKGNAAEMPGGEVEKSLAY